MLTVLLAMLDEPWRGRIEKEFVELFGKSAFDKVQAEGLEGIEAAMDLNV
jgi:hypothetical protein